MKRFNKTIKKNKKIKLVEKNEYLLGNNIQVVMEC